MGSRKKRSNTRSEGIKLNEICYWLASTFGWEKQEIYSTTIPELNYFMEGGNSFIEKQNKEMKKSSGKSSGKFQPDSIDQLKNLPGVKVVKKKNG